MRSNTPWLRTIEQFEDEAIASIAVRLAPMGRTDTDTLLSLHLGMTDQSVSTIASRTDAIAELAALGSFDHTKLSKGAWRMFKDRTEFMGCVLPVGWLAPERRRLAPGRMAADGKNARIKNAWLLSGLICDIETGETLLDRCPKCLNLLAWRNLPNVWSCQVCKLDLRSVAPRQSPPEIVAAAKELARYLFDHDLELPAPVSNLSCLDVLKFAAWLSYFRWLAEDLSLAISPKNTPAGFLQLKRWPASFDEIVLQKMRASAAEELTRGDVISRIKAAGTLSAAVARLPSAAAQEIVRSRVEALFGFADGSSDGLKDVMMPISELNSRS